mmetsp:Transcript_38306/g.43743  ORF Transcript_38306/g.43743 Transcript_38306/m.43743 type:complete len:297 (-) Transcript_38306:1158-2048(-)
MSPATIATVNGIKASLANELPVDRLTEESTERCQDMFKQLENCNINLKVLTETLIGTVVSKFKSHEKLGPIAKNLVKKWKKAARENKLTSAKKLRARESVSDLPLADEWKDLPPLRQNIAKKLNSLLELSRNEMINAGLNSEAFNSVCISCATEIEVAIEKKHGRDHSDYKSKARSLVFNLKKNGSLRNQLLMGATTSSELISMASEDLATSEKTKERDAEVSKLRDSRLLDWDQKNENKINEMCGIKGDLLQASLFTCGRCKSIKTTSTQKQTRSADEPMTVFVLCLNCGNRWKC